MPTHRFELRYSQGKKTFCHLRLANSPKTEQSKSTCIFEGYARNPQSSLHSLRGTPRAPPAQKRCYFVPMRTVEVRGSPKRADASFGGSRGCRSLQINVRSTFGRGGVSPPLPRSVQAFPQNRKGNPKGKTCAGFCLGKIQTGLPLGALSFGTFLCASKEKW